MLTMPAFSPTTEDGKISWSRYVEVGDKVRTGTVLGEVRVPYLVAYNFPLLNGPYAGGSKNLWPVDIEAQNDGFLAKLLVEQGTVVPVGAPVAVLVENEADVAAFADFEPPDQQ